MTRLTRPLLTLPLLALPLLCGFKPYAPPPVRAEPVELSIVNRDSGHALPWYRQNGQAWVAGQQGQPYSLRLSNNSAQRVLVVLSVDGLNVISGQVAAPDQTGYVLRPWQTADITGWRKSQQEVAQFVFTDPGRSYASRTGRPDNIGVIGMAVFNEAPEFSPPPRPAAAIARSRVQAQAESSDRALSSVEVTGSVAAAPAPALGTGHGPRERSYSGSTDFRRASSTPAQWLEVRYDSERNLVARGIMSRPRPQRPGEPQAFPGQFVPDPPAWGHR